MLPDGVSIITIILLAFFIVLVASVLPKRLNIIVEITLIVAVLVYLFIGFSFGEAMMLFSLGATAYSNFSMLMDNDKRKRREKLAHRLRVSDFQTMMQVKDHKRIVVDILLTIIVSSGAIIFYLFAPETYIILKFIILIGLVTVLTQTIGRIGSYLSTSIYWLPNEKRLIVLSIFESRDYPLGDLKEVKRESTPDLLRLHPLFTFLSENKDYTTSFHSVLQLSFPGENVYFTPNEMEKWYQTFGAFIDNSEREITKQVLPIWHPKNVKRLFWKGYFAVTVKGISAYTALLFILIWFKVPSYMIIAFVFIWWFFNLYISDRVLIAATDAKEVTGGEIYSRAKRIFNEAGIPNTRLYVIDSPVYNGLATGMNIGKGTVMLTKATTQLSLGAVEAILAHEAIHVKKRDILVNQLARIFFFGLIALLVYVFFDQIQLLAENLFVFIPLFYLLMMLFPMYLTFVAQWTEVRADHLGASLLTGGVKQMKNGLRELANAQDKALDKSAEYSMVTENRMKVTRMVERDNWFFRVIEFQFQSHPPMYYRINSLAEYKSWHHARKGWMLARFLESLPDPFRKGKKA